ncbi:lysosomal phospholipase A and acyltransferase [Halyomorpha halys]|uniref:lysosomal phospholipase A and acyltransferase n=1 Tax=Halyomorpha halys TaxID=286706 RepID=UPI0006D4D96B|nr:group XV phospholipase A2-like [Halyomorpha halys]
MAKYSHLLLVLVIHLTRIHFVCPLGCLQKEDLVPVILVPGVGGSQLEAQLDKPTVTHHYCTRRSFDYTSLWLNVKQLLPKLIECWVDNMKLNYDDLSNKTFNQPGVKTRIRNFGDPKVVEYLDPSARHFFGGYLNQLARELVDIGYIRQKNLYAAPYDFRKGPSELSHFFEELEQLVEEAHDYNNSPVVLIGHSMGGQLTLKFLQDQSQQWKDKYVGAFISLSAPFGGTMKSLKTFVAGDDLGVFFLNSKVLKDVLSTMPSMAYLIPTKQLWNDDILVTTAEKNYTLKNLEELFDDIGNPTGWKMYLNEKKFTEALSPPGVEVHCFYGEGVATLKRLIYMSNDFDGTPLMEYENGDGTANLRSLKYCKNWIKHQEQRVETKSFDRVNHMGIIEDKWVLHYIIKTLKELSSC